MGDIQFFLKWPPVTVTPKKYSYDNDDQALTVLLYKLTSELFRLSGGKQCILSVNCAYIKHLFDSLSRKLEQNI